MKLYLLSTTLLLLSLTGCATIFSGTKEKVTIDSQPQGAEVRIDGEYAGKTPITFLIERKTIGQRFFTLTHEGYQSKRMRLDKGFNPVTLINCTSWPSWLTDGLTGAMFTYSPNSYFIPLSEDPAGKSPDSNLEANSVVDPAMQYMLFNFDAIKTDIVQGGGHNFSAFATLLNVSNENQSDFLNGMRASMEEERVRLYPSHFWNSATSQI